MVPLNRVFNSVRPHLPCGKVLIRSFVVALTGASREGRLWACIPWPGRRTLPCVLVFVFMVPCPRLGPFCYDVAIGVFGRHGATQDLDLRGSWSEWPGRVHDKGRVSSEFFGPPEWECEAMCSVVWVKCATSTVCI